METYSPYGKASVALGSLGIVLASVAQRYELWSQAGRGYVLNLVDSWGIIRAPHGAAELSAPGLLALNDVVAVQHMFRLAFACGVFALLLLGAAEVRREHNLYPSVGFACAYCAMLLVSPWGAAAVAFVVAIAVTLFRHARA